MWQPSSCGCKGGSALLDRPRQKGEGTGPNRFALAGSPNAGNSTVFNRLTGLSQHVGNWAGKTVEQKMGTCSLDGREVEIVDLPGTYSLTANSVEEQVARGYIIRQQPDVVVAILSAAQLERNLYLLAELLELQVPVVVGLNMMDVAREQGRRVEANVLQAALGVPVVPMSAGRGQGESELLVVGQVSDGAVEPAPRRADLGEDLEGLVDRVEEQIGDDAPPGYPRRWLALKLLEGDREVADLFQNACRQTASPTWKTCSGATRTPSSPSPALATPGSSAWCARPDHGRALGRSRSPSIWTAWLPTYTPGRWCCLACSVSSSLSSWVRAHVAT